jgi:hypothetical protein
MSGWGQTRTDGPGLGPRLDAKVTNHAQPTSRSQHAQPKITVAILFLFGNNCPNID